MRVVVFGATGDQGSAQVKALARAGHHPVAVSRNPRPLDLEGRRIETCATDLADAASLRAAVRGAEAVFLNLPSTSFQAAEPLVAAVDRLAAIAGGETSIRTLVFNTSLPVPKDKRGFAAQDARHDMRARLFATEVATISIEPVVFLDNWLKGWAWPSIEQHGKLVYAHAPDLAVSWICHDDLAALMIAAMTRPELAGRSFAVGGPETVCLPELAVKLGRAWNRQLDWESQSIDAFCQRMRQVFEGRSSLEADRLISELHRIYTWYNTAPEQPFKVDMRPVLAELPVRLTPIEEWAVRQQLPVLSSR
jgi:uncharacterized protein YbjT (DUF2867 family)